MAPQATLVVPTPTASTAISTSAAAKHGRKPFVPVLLLIFLGVCLAYTMSYILYRIVMARRRASQQDNPDTPDRGVSRFMNGARLSLSFGHKSTTTTPNLSESPNMINKAKHSTGAHPHPSHQELPMPSPAESSSTPFLTLMPTFTMHSDREIGELQPQVQDPTKATSSFLAPPPIQKPFAQRVAAKVNCLPNDRAEAMALDPKLAPVQGPLRPLSTIGSTPRKKRTSLFGLGLKSMHGRNGESAVELGTR